MKEINFDNTAVAKLLRQMAAAHEAQGANPFTIRAYQNAADTASQTSSSIYDLWSEGKLNLLPGFGSAISSYLGEFFKSGKVKHFEVLKKALPAGMFEILGLPHVGAKTALRLSKMIKIRPGRGLADLEKAAQQGKIRVLEGFGAQSEKEILEGIKKTKSQPVFRMLIAQANAFADPIIDYLRKSSLFVRADKLGSLRRFAPTVGDIDIAAAVKNKVKAIEYFLKYPQAKETLWSGDNKATIVLKVGTQIDLMVESTDAYGALLQHFTGSKNHNIQLRELALKKGLSLSEHGIKNLKSGKITKFASEEQFYNFLDLDWIAPELREGVGEVEAATKGKLPQLVELPDIKGDLQSHSIWSDGEETAQNMARRAQSKGYGYLGLTDHQLSLEKLGTAKILQVIRKRKRAIEQINSSLRSLRVLNGIEILIKANGELAYSDELLKEFDFVIASIHTGFNLHREINTRRIVKALKNPYVSILGHPTGRLINSREPLEADWEEIFKVCPDEGKILEINAGPERLDLNDTLIKQAKSLGNRFVINTDAHSLLNFDNMIYGLGIARRGWLTKNDVVNCLPFDKMVKELKIRW